MSRLPSTPDPAQLSDRIPQSLRQAADADLRLLADRRASKPDHPLLGPTAFEGRDRVHRSGAKALPTALDERNPGAPKAPARAARVVTAPASSRIVGTRPSSA
jgi:hypothetical protein